MCNKIINTIKNYLFPVVDKEVQNNIDKESLNNLRLLSVAVAWYELFSVVFFVLTREHISRDNWISIGSVLFCFFSCVIVFFYTNMLRKQENVSHFTVTAVNIFLTLIMSAWAIWVSWRHYTLDDQLFTFFAVQLMIVCFITFKPLISAVLMLYVYGGLYITCYTVDRAASVNFFNFMAVVLLSITGMIVRYHSQIKLSEKTVMLENNNEALEYASRHDGLTGLRNRMALDEDVAQLTGKHLRVFMIDVDCFKEINDRHGHSVGDAVLKETAETLKRIYPDSFRYRYGGDEFLVISTNTELYDDDTYRFPIPGVSDDEVLLSIGMSEGTPQDYGQLFGLISRADEGLYEVKRRTHSPEFGGRDRRRR
jgi:diguanylate cyclase (GGDEF)-like protein